jgi:copper chaperone NosL
VKTILAYGAGVLFAGMSLIGCAKTEDIGPPEIRLGQDTCQACGMIIEDERFAAAVVTSAGGVVEKRAFDDIGEMLEFKAPSGASIVHRYVRDAATKQWLDADKATFVKLRDLTTPMGSGIAAYADAEGAKSAIRAHGGELVSAGSVAEKSPG